MYKTILFDLDGTLLDTTDGVIEAVKITIQELGLKMPNEDVLKAFVGPPMQSSFQKYFDLDKETALKNANLFRANYKKHSLFIAKPYAGSLELLEYLKENGCKLAVATNKSHENAMGILDKFGISKYLDYALGSDLEGKLTKKDIVNICIEKLNAKKEECVLIGDSTADSTGAKEAGIDFIALTYGFGFKSKNDLDGIANVGIYNSIEELKEYFEKETLCLKN